MRRGSHCPRCPHRELSPPSAAALTFPLQGESWGRGDLALLLSPRPLSTSQPGREASLEHKPLSAWTPAHLSTFRAQHYFPTELFLTLPPCSLFGNCAALLHTEECTQQCLFQQEKHASHNPKPPQTHFKGCRMTPVPGSWLCCCFPGWVSAQLYLLVLALPVAICWSQARKANTGAGPAFPSPVGLREGPQGRVVWDGRLLTLLASSSLPVPTPWSSLCLFLLGAGTGEQHPLLQPAPAALLLEYRKEFPLLNINIPVAKCIQM